MRSLTLLIVGIVCVLAACSSSSGQGAGESDGGAGDGSVAESGNGGDSGPGETGAADGSVGADGRADGGNDATMPEAATDAMGDVASEADAPSGPVYPDAGADCGIGASGEPLDLACTGLYSDWANKTVAPGIEAYEPGYVLWSDGALKSRWIALPAGKQIDTSNVDEWTFPVGTRIWKEFSLVLPDAGAPTRIETRLIWKQSPGTWYWTTYRWSSDGQSSATELTTGETNVAGTTYEVPSPIECYECHGGRKDFVLGFEAVALSAPNATGLTMAQLVAQNLVTTPPSGSLAVPGDSTTAATLGWLHMNCGVTCHNNVGGIASDTQFWMRLNAASLASVQATDTYTSGWNVQTQAFQIPDAGTTYRFHACDLASSAAYYRANHRTGVNGAPQGIQMPPLVSHAVDDADMATLAAWIDEGCGDAGVTDGSPGD
jgi:hypothetical protein